MLNSIMLVFALQQRAPVTGQSSSLAPVPAAPEHSQNLAQLHAWHMFHLSHLAHLAYLARTTARASAAQTSAASAPSAPVAGGGYGQPNYCGDGDGDGWDLPCSALHPAAVTASVTHNDGDADSDDSTVTADPAAQPAQQPAAPAPDPVSGNGGSGGSGGGSLGGTLSYSGLEQLWMAAGGSPGAAATAACIAEHESGGNQYATGSVGEEGFWQINPVNGSLATYNAYGNARSAIILSHNGTDWSAWTTAPSCGV